MPIAIRYLGREPGPPSDYTLTELNRFTPKGYGLDVAWVYAEHTSSRTCTQNSILRGGLILAETGIPPARNGQLSWRTETRVLQCSSGPMDNLFYGNRRM